ncbi:hypothetical protein GWI33_016237 [Rhynchophorus ferrugineus]|uniref:Uncharacterized protein n=1 Tax=Rhynchophorus ferrugineus TaxID=354439 RepID=A0A834HYD8_RHYFE|nr:hypothetical protein GWI33_016237 [Rhynchophorus ferrugineus]
MHQYPPNLRKPLRLLEPKSAEQCLSISDNQKYSQHNHSEFPTHNTTASNQHQSSTSRLAEQGIFFRPLKNLQNIQHCSRIATGPKLKKSGFFYTASDKDFREFTNILDSKKMNIIHSDPQKTGVSAV